MMKVYITRDRDGKLFIFSNKPKKYEGDGVWSDDTSVPLARVIDKILPDGVDPQWIDNEPTEINIEITNASDPETVIIPKDWFKELLGYREEYKRRVKMMSQIVNGK